jgi:hypothetical protein
VNTREVEHIMSKIVTLRLSEEEYKQILISAKNEDRPISNFITHVVINNIVESRYVDPIEMAQIKSDENLLKRLEVGHKEAKGRKGKFVE